MNYTTQPPSESSTTRGETSLPTKSQLHSLLSSETRRHLLDILADSPAPHDLQELARAAVGRSEVDGPVDDVADTVAVELHHNHLPRLEDAGLIRYDHDSNQIEAIHPAVSERRLGVPI